MIAWLLRAAWKGTDRVERTEVQNLAIKISKTPEGIECCILILLARPGSTCNLPGKKARGGLNLGRKKMFRMKGAGRDLASFSGKRESQKANATGKESGEES